MTTPNTAGRALLLSIAAFPQGPGSAMFGQECRNLILAIQAEARADADAQLLALREALAWVRSTLRYDPPIVTDPERVAAVIDRALTDTVQAGAEAKARIEAPWREALAELARAAHGIYGMNEYDAPMATARALLDKGAVS